MYIVSTTTHALLAGSALRETKTNRALLLHLPSSELGCSSLLTVANRVFARNQIVRTPAHLCFSSYILSHLCLSSYIISHLCFSCYFCVSTQVIFDEDVFILAAAGGGLHSLAVAASKGASIVVLGFLALLAVTCRRIVGGRC